MSKTRQENILDKSQTPQRGFTEGVSLLYAGLLISEAFCEAYDNQTKLLLQTMDAEKAFDIVWHDSLLGKLFNDGMSGDLWLMVKSLHTDANNSINGILNKIE